MAKFFIEEIRSASTGIHKLNHTSNEYEISLAIDVIHRN